MSGLFVAGYFAFGNRKASLFQCAKASKDTRATHDSDTDFNLMRRANFVTCGIDVAIFKLLWATLNKSQLFY